MRVSRTNLSEIHSLLVPDKRVKLSFRCSSVATRIGGAAGSSRRKEDHDVHNVFSVSCEADWQCGCCIGEAHFILYVEVEAGWQCS